MLGGADGTGWPQVPPPPLLLLPTSLLPLVPGCPLSDSLVTGIHQRRGVLRAQSRGLSKVLPETALDLGSCPELSREVLIRQSSITPAAQPVTAAAMIPHLPTLMFSFTVDKAMYN